MRASCTDSSAVPAPVAWTHFRHQQSGCSRIVAVSELQQIAQQISVVSSNPIQLFSTKRETHLMRVRYYTAAQGNTAVKQRCLTTAAPIWKVASPLCSPATEFTSTRSMSATTASSDMTCSRRVVHTSTYLFRHRSGAMDLRLCRRETFGFSQNSAKLFVPYVGRAGSLSSPDVNCQVARKLDFSEQHACVVSQLPVGMIMNNLQLG